MAYLSPCLCEHPCQIGEGAPLFETEKFCNPHGHPCSCMGTRSVFEILLDNEVINAVCMEGERAYLVAFLKASL